MAEPRRRASASSFAERLIDTVQGDVDELKETHVRDCNLRREEIVNVAERVRQLELAQANLTTKITVICSIAAIVAAGGAALLVKLLAP